MCDYCDYEFSNKLIGSDDFDNIPELTMTAEIKNQREVSLLWLEFIHRGRDTVYCSQFPINYCPICGRKLED